MKIIKHIFLQHLFYIISILLFLLFSSKSLLAQDKNLIDSLQNELNKYEKHKIETGKNFNPLMDSSKANILIRLSMAYWNSDPDKALSYAQDGLSISQNSNYQKGVSKAWSSMGIIYRNKGDFKTAMDYLQKSITLSIKNNDKEGTARAYNNMGLCYSDQGNYPEALKHHFNALKIREQINDRQGIAASYNNIGNCYMSEGNYDEALSYQLAGLKINEEVGSKENIGNSCNNVAIVYNTTGKYAEAIEYYKKSLEIRQAIGDKKGIAVTLDNMGHMYYGGGDYEAGLKNILEALKIKKEIGDKHGMVLSLFYIAEIYRLQNKFDEAIKYASEGLALALEIGALDWAKIGYEGLADINYQMHNYKAAYENAVLFKKMNDSIYNSDNTKKITQLQMQYEFGKKEDSLNYQQLLTTEKFKQHQQQLELQLDLSNKETDLQKLAYLKTQADLQNEQLQKKEKEKQLTLSEKEKQLQQSKVNSLTQSQKLNKLQLQQQWIYSIAILLLLGLASSWFIYNNRLKQHRLKTELVKEKAEQENKEAEFQRSLADISLTALRSQMNPHFIFNCLNSIKFYTTKNNTAAASEYLTKFSRLIRLVMDNSRNDRISLSSELNALQLYIEMEAMRFKEKLQYSIDVEKNVETDYIEIPPLLLQPYVENAIWHGLMHKDEGGKIDVDVTMNEGKSLLQISITDNGIGREKSAVLKSKTATKHKSYGMRITCERIALINRIYKTGADVIIHDLMNDGKPSGTKVIIQIPV